MYSLFSILSWWASCSWSMKSWADLVRRSWSGYRGQGQGSQRQARSSTYGSTPNRGCSGLRSTCCFCITSFGIRVRGGDSPEVGHCSRVGALLPMVGAMGRASSFSVRTHGSLGVSLGWSGYDEKLVRLKSHWGSPREGTRLRCRWCAELAKGQRWVSTGLYSPRALLHK